MAKGMPRAFPFYVVCDVSQSMRNEKLHGLPTPFTVLLSSLSQMIFMLDENYTAAEAAHLSIVNFADQATVTLPMTRAAEINDPLPSLIEGGQTNYAAVFDLMRSVVASDCQRLAPEHELRPPVVFFLTDGQPFVGDAEQPDSAWLPLRNAFAATGFPSDRPPPSHEPYILAFGFGQAKTSTLCKVASIDNGRRLAFIAGDGEQVSDVLKNIAESILKSIVSSVRRSQLEVVPPEGMTWVDCQAGGDWA